MTHQGNGQYSCDECPESIDTETKDFEEQREKLLAAGWRTFKGPDKKWAHACPVCVADFASRNRA